MLKRRKKRVEPQDDVQNSIESIREKGKGYRSNRLVFRRVVILMVIFGVLIYIPLGVKLYRLQIVQHDYLEQKAIDQQTEEAKVTPNRGTIFDRNLSVIASSGSVDTVGIDPSNIKDEATAKLVSEGLAGILDMNYEWIYEQTQKKNTRFVYIKRKIEKTLANKVRDYVIENKLHLMISIAPDSKRYYSDGRFASQVLGFVNIDNTGSEGIEAKYDSLLKGTPGHTIAVTDRAGRIMPFQYEMFYDATDGQDLVLTIDESIQYFVEKHMETAYIESDVGNPGGVSNSKERQAGYAGAIVMDVKTGAILAMTTKGDYDLNNPRVVADPEIAADLGLLEGEEYNSAFIKALQAQWRNKVISDTYEPGSTFKIMTAAMALEENVVDVEHDRYNCTGSVQVGKWPISCHKKAPGHGVLTFEGAILNSCNPSFIAIAKKVGPEKFYQYMQDFGFMEKTNIDLAGEASNKGLYASYKTFSEDPAAQAVYSFGQTFKVTPIQLLTAVCSVANGGYLMKPYVVSEAIDQNGVRTTLNAPTVRRQVVSTETSEQMRVFLEHAVTDGSGKNAYVKGYRIAGKTGTSQKRDVYNEDGIYVGEGLYVCSFVGFAPADDPQVAILVMLDEPGGPVNTRFGSTMAAPVAGRIFADILPYLGITPHYTEEEMQSMDIATPSVANKSVKEAKSAFEKVGMKCKVIGDGNIVLSQVPAAGVMLPASAEALLFTVERNAEEMVTVPNVVGKSPEEVNRILTNAGLFLKAVGASISSSSQVSSSHQDIEANTSVAYGTIVKVEFRDTSLRDAEGR